MSIKAVVFQPTLSQYLASYLIDPEYEKTCPHISWNRYSLPIIGMGKRLDHEMAQWEPCVLDTKGDIVIAKSLPNLEGIVAGKL